MVIFLNFAANTQPVFYRLPTGKLEEIIVDGNFTGLYQPEYGELRSAMLSVSPNKGSSEVEQFGSVEDYDRTMTTADPKCPIDEDAILWVDNADTDGPHNYIVKRKSPWFNSTQYAIKRVEVSYASETSEDGDNANNQSQP